LYDDGDAATHSSSIGSELLAGGGELAQVRADRVQQGASGTVVGPLARPPELGPDEGQPVGEPGDLRALDHLRSRGLHLRQQLLALGRARMGHDQRHVRSRAGRVPGQLGGDLLGRVLRGPDHDHAPAPEQ